MNQQLRIRAGGSAPRLVLVPAVMAFVFVLAGCNAAVQTPTPAPQPPSPTPTMDTGGNVTPEPGAYPKYGHAADYSWIAGKVTFTQIQGGCIFILTTERTAPEETTPEAGYGTPIVGTAVKGDTSPPLRDITPVLTQPEQPIGESFSPNGPGWDPSSVQDGEFVVAFGRIAGPGDPIEMCPTGTPYFVEHLQKNP